MKIERPGLVLPTEHMSKLNTVQLWGHGSRGTTVQLCHGDTTTLQAHMNVQEKVRHKNLQCKNSSMDTESKAIPHQKNYKGSNSGIMDSPITFIEGAPVYLPVALLRLTILLI